MSLTISCPKCGGTMHTHSRSGVQIEQCANCHGIFLDHGELEALGQLAAAWAHPPATPPPVHGPSWGPQQYGYHAGHRKKSFLSMLMSS